MTLSLVDLVGSFINAKDGWAVAEQFEATFGQGESFEDQNGNALRYVRSSVSSLIHSDLLNEDSVEELQDYLDKLDEYLRN